MGNGGVQIGAMFGLELLKMFLSYYFSAAAMVGMTEEQIDALFQEQLLKFRQNRPENLPQV